MSDTNGKMVFGPTEDVMKVMRAYLTATSIQFERRGRNEFHVHGINASGHKVLGLGPITLLAGDSLTLTDVTAHTNIDDKS